MKRFNTTGLCLQADHYMCDVSAKFARCKYLVEEGYYYAINFPRQYGKTTMKSLLKREFDKKADYLVIATSLEGIGDMPFESEATLAPMILKVFAKGLFFNKPELAGYLREQSQAINNFEDLSLFISDWIYSLNKKVVLIIDEIDKASNNQVFISFIAMLRDKYLAMKDDEDLTFHSVILLGVHDVKSLKLKLRPDEESKLNSPWNVAKNLDISFAFSALEIEPMLADYAEEHDFIMNCPALAEQIFYYTAGYPFLISQMCAIIDEKFMVADRHAWTLDDIDAAAKEIIREDFCTTNIDDLVKNLEGNKELYQMTFKVIFGDEKISFNMRNYIISLGVTYGVFAKSGINETIISNRIYEQIIKDFMMSKQETGTGLDLPLSSVIKSQCVDDNGLNVVTVLEKFQAFMKEHYSTKNERFLEDHARFIFLTFLRPIVNGEGFVFKEPEVGDERRMDVVITFRARRYVIELKIWRGPKQLGDGIEQICDYLDHYSLAKGYMLIFNFNKNRQYETKIVENCRKQITAVFV